jgi:hypothetical protein
MVELYINNKRVFFDNSKQIKITVENPYFASAKSYTLDITIPTMIFDNRKIFGSIDRFEIRKNKLSFPARLVFDNRTLLFGSAQITKVARKNVTVQVVGSMIGDKFFGEFGELYVDELKIGGWLHPEETEIGTMPFDRYSDEYIFMPVWDETNSVVRNERESRIFPDDDGEGMGLPGGVQYKIYEPHCPMPRFMYLLQRIIEVCGYTLAVNNLEIEPWTHLYIANAHTVDDLCEVLPHWTVTEFFKEVENFFNVSIIFDAETKRVSIIKNVTFFDGREHNFSRIDEYQVEIKDIKNSEKSLSYSNIRYDISESEEHKEDVLSDELLENIKTFVFATHQETIKYCNSLSEERRKQVLFKDNTGYYVWGETGDKWSLRLVNEFGQLTRHRDSDNTIDLRICPCAISRKHPMQFTRWRIYGYSVIWEAYPPMLSMENPFGPAVTDDDEEQVEQNVWNMILGEVDVPVKIDGEDRIQVFFFDGYAQGIKKEVDGEYSPIVYYPIPLTDWRKDFFDTGYMITQNQWSLSLVTVPDTDTLAINHTNPYSINTDVEYRIDFEIGDMVPDITKVFMFNNKRYICRKYEYILQNNKLNAIVSGYFYEMAAS